MTRPWHFYLPSFVRVNPISSRVQFMDLNNILATKISPAECWFLLGDAFFRKRFQPASKHPGFTLRLHNLTEIRHFTWLCCTPNPLKTPKFACFVNILWPSTPYNFILKFSRGTYARGLAPSFFDSLCNQGFIKAVLFLPQHFKALPMHGLEGQGMHTFLVF